MTVAVIRFFAGQNIEICSNDLISTANKQKALGEQLNKQRNINIIELIIIRIQIGK